jgi:small subunit ribosomal protein S4
MALYRGPVCRLCRREGEKLFLKGERCFTSKCAVERRESAPGQHGKARQGRSDYKQQLRAKQKARRIYGVLEKQFRTFFEKAARQKGVTGTELLTRLETRLDNVVYKMGFGLSRNHSRQIVSHGNVMVNNKKVDIPSYQVSVGDVIEIQTKQKQNINVKAAMEFATSRVVPDWLSLDKSAVKGTVNALPTREAMPQNIEEQLIVELYSK